MNLLFAPFPQKRGQKQKSIDSPPGFGGRGGAQAAVQLRLPESRQSPCLESPPRCSAFHALAGCPDLRRPPRYAPFITRPESGLRQPSVQTIPARGQSGTIALPA